VTARGYDQYASSRPQRRNPKNEGLTPAPSESGRVIYGAQLGDKWFVVVDELEGKKYDGIAGLIFSLDSMQVAYVARLGDKWFVVVDEEEGKKYDGIITAGGARLIFNSLGDLHYLAVRGNRIYLVTERIE